MAVFTGLGSATSPSITFSADTNTGVFSPGADTLALATGGVNRLHITSAGNVGIGTTNPGQLLHLSSPDPRINLEDTDAGGIFQIRNTSGAGFIATLGSHPLVFLTDSAERARIDAGGRLLVGTSSARGNFFVDGSVPSIQSEGTTGSTSQISLVRNANSDGGPALVLGKTRATSVGGSDAVLDNDRLGFLVFEGANGTKLIRAAQIQVIVDGTPSGDSVPARMTFNTLPVGGTGGPIERLRISSNGRVSVGNQNPDGTFHVRSLVGTDPFIVENSSASEVLRITNARVLRFETTSNAPGNANTATGIVFNNDAIYASKEDEFSITANRNSDGRVIRISRSGTQVGTISVTATNTAYNTSSDYRLKENVVDLDGAIDRLKQLPVHRFNFIVDPDTVVDGFIAHEAAEVIPECVTGTKDEMEAIGTLAEWNGKVIDTDVIEPEDLTWEDQVEVTPAVEATYDEEGNELTPAADAVYETVTRTRTWEKTGERPVYQGIDQSKIVPLLTAALQEAIDRIESLEAEVTALKS